MFVCKIAAVQALSAGEADKCRQKRMQKQSPGHNIYGKSKKVCNFAVH